MHMWGSKQLSDPEPNVNPRASTGLYQQTMTQETVGTACKEELIDSLVLSQPDGFNLNC